MQVLILITKEVKTMVVTAYSADPSENGGYSTTKLETKLDMELLQ